MASHTAPAAVSDQVMAERSIMYLSIGEAVYTALQQLQTSADHTTNVCTVVVYSAFYWWMTAGVFVKK